MKKAEYCRKLTDLGKYGRRTLVYSMVTCDDGRFGISVSIPEFGESETVRDVSSDKERVLSLLDMLATNYVTPIALCDVLEDWLGT